MEIQSKKNIRYTCGIFHQKKKSIRMVTSHDISTTVLSTPGKALRVFFSFSISFSLHGSTATVVAVDAKLHEDDGVLGHGAQRADQPGQVGEEVLPLERVEQDSGAVGEVAQQGEHEEEDGEALARFVAVVFDDLGNTGSASQSFCQRICSIDFVSLFSVDFLKTYPRYATALAYPNTCAPAAMGSPCPSSTGTGFQAPALHAMAHPAAPTTQTPTMLTAFFTHSLPPLSSSTMLARLSRLLTLSLCLHEAVDDFLLWLPGRPKLSLFRLFSKGSSSLAPLRAEAWLSFRISALRALRML